MFETKITEKALDATHFAEEASRDSMMQWLCLVEMELSMKSFPGIDERLHS